MVILNIGNWVLLYVLEETKKGACNLQLFMVILNIENSILLYIL